MNGRLFMYVGPALDWHELPHFELPLLEAPAQQPSGGRAVRKMNGLFQASTAVLRIRPKFRRNVGPFIFKVWSFLMTIMNDSRLLSVCLDFSPSVPSMGYTVHIVHASPSSNFFIISCTVYLKFVKSIKC